MTPGSDPSCHDLSEGTEGCQGLTDAAGGLYVARESQNDEFCPIMLASRERDQRRWIRELKPSHLGPAATVVSTSLLVRNSGADYYLKGGRAENESTLC